VEGKYGEEKGPNLNGQCGIRGTGSEEGLWLEVSGGGSMGKKKREG
jgi:hypothetical protein